MPVIERRFAKVESDPGDSDFAPHAFSAYFGHAAIVVLGDPGAGKTTEFKAAANEEPDAQFVTVRDFLALSPNRWRGKTLYLDGLDEQRAKTDDGGAILDQIRGRLDALDSPTFRLSCRAADWYGSLDVRSLSAVAADGTVTVLRLEPLTDANISAIAGNLVPDAEAFIDEARERGIYDLLQNPQTLKLILSVVGQGGWPETRTELYQRACEILAREVNEERGRIDAVTSDSGTILEAAGHLCAVHLCGGTAGFALAEANSNYDFPDIDELKGDLRHLRLAAGRRLFRSEGPERIVPAHRTIAEFLAARHLARCIQDGLPMGRVLALVTGNDGGTLSDLRGLYAWLACACTEHTEALIAKDPLGVVLYGDVAPFPPSVKRLVIERLAYLADRNPWFRSEDWASRPFGALSSPEMEPFFRLILEDSSRHPVLVSCVLDGIRHGQPMPELGDLLLDIVRDATRREFLRVDALHAFKNACPTRVEDLVQLLKDVHAGQVLDEERRLRGNLLRALYPDAIEVGQVLQYLVDEHPNFLGEYIMFVSNDLVNTTDPNQLPLLLDVVAQSGLPGIHRDGFMRQQFVGRLLFKTLSWFGEYVPTKRVYRWLGVALGEHHKPLVRDEESAAIKMYFETHPWCIRWLFGYWLSITSRENIHYEEFLFWERLHSPEPPAGFAQWLLDRAVHETDASLANFLFQKAVQLRTAYNRADAPTLDDLFAFVEDHPRFKDTFRTNLYCQISDVQRQHAISRKERRAKREAARSGQVRSLSQQLDEIRMGTAVGPLNFLAKLYFCLFSDVDRDLEPEARLVAETNAQVATAALEGFVRTLGHSQTPSPEQIGETDARSRHFDFGFVVLAGMDLVCARSMTELLALPNNILQSALTFHYANMLGNKCSWVGRVLTDRPEVAAPAMETFWRAHLAHNCSHIPALYALDHEDNMATVAQRTVLPLLGDYPACAEGHLETLLRAAVRYADHGKLLDLTSDILGRRGAVRKAQRVLWFSVAFILAPEKFGNKLARYINWSEEKASRLLEFFVPSFPSASRTEVLLPTAALARLIRIVAPVVPPRVDDHGFPTERAAAVKSLIDRLGNETTLEAAEALAKVQGDPAMVAHADSLAHAAMIQARNRREANFRYPPVDKVVETLRDGRPANAPDIQAFVADHVRTLGHELRDGPTDGYKMFWNVDQYAKPIAPRPENDCRDRLLDRLRPILVRVGINGEPEGHYARDKRADIKVLCGPLNLPVEIKRHYHRDLWLAPNNQLRKLYIRDPGTKGRGIYLVLWFGTDAGRRLPMSPPDITLPQTPAELEEALSHVIPEDDRALIDVIVLDVSGS